jgi:hypothetical protein
MAHEIPKTVTKTMIVVAVAMVIDAMSLVMKNVTKPRQIIATVHVMKRLRHFAMKNVRVSEIPMKSATTTAAKTRVINLVSPRLKL